ncbi:unnamed protein product, partial [Larinioides sclopetarius]
MKVRLEVACRSGRYIDAACYGWMLFIDPDNMGNAD